MSETRPPNVLVIMGDHFRHDAMRWTGNPVAHTPNLDQMAAGSVRFRNCFCQSPVCSPARHSLNTGQYAHRHGVVANGLEPYDGMFTLAHALKPHGYRCTHRGHMHWVGDSDNGYEPKGTGWIGNDEFGRSVSEAARERMKAESATPVRRTTGGPGPRTAEEHGGHYVMTKTIEDIRESVQAGKPFLAWAAFSEPHPPWYPPVEFYRLIDTASIALPAQAPEGAAQPHPIMANRRREWAHLTEYEVRQIIAAYYGLVALLDSCVGRILDTLDQLGIADNTIVVWSSDHGDQLGEHGLFLKFVMRESSVRVPLMIRLPERISQDRSELVEHIDLFPTICNLVGVDVPDTVQGHSLTPLLGSGPAPADWRDAVFSQIDHCDIQANVEMIRTEEWKLNLYDGRPGELYDLANDPDEYHNRVGDPACAQRMSELHERLAQWRKRFGPPPGVGEH